MDQPARLLTTMPFKNEKIEPELGQITLSIESAQLEGFFSSPYIKIQAGRFQFQTSTKHSDRTPIWNESFIFTLLAADNIVISLYDFKLLQEDHLIGSAQVPIPLDEAEKICSLSFSSNQSVSLRVQLSKTLSAERLEMLLDTHWPEEKNCKKKVRDDVRKMFRCWWAYVSSVAATKLTPGTGVIANKKGIVKTYPTGPEAERAFICEKFQVGKFYIFWHQASNRISHVASTTGHGATSGLQLVHCQVQLLPSEIDPQRVAVPFIFDTGSDRTYLPSQLTDGIPATGRGYVIHGNEIQTRTQFYRVNLELDGLRTVVIVGSIGSDGFLGLNLIKKYRCLIDFSQAAKIQIGALPGQRSDPF